MLTLTTKSVKVNVNKGKEAWHMKQLRTAMYAYYYRCRVTGSGLLAYS